MSERRKPCWDCGGPKGDGKGRRVCPPCADRRKREYVHPADRKYNVERFMSNVTELDGHWFWDGGIGANNYPEYGGRWAHRVSHEIFIGPIPQGLEVDHVCRIPLCVRPAHLEAVTHLENQRRRAAAITACKWGHQYTDENTGRDRLGARFCLTCRRLRYRGTHPRQLAEAASELAIQVERNAAVTL